MQLDVAVHVAVQVILPFGIKGYTSWATYKGTCRSNRGPANEPCIQACVRKTEKLAATQHRPLIVVRGEAAGHILAHLQKGGLVTERVTDGARHVGSIHRE